MCPFPISVKDMVLPCGRCGLCVKARKEQWMIRMSEELKDHESAYFLTLTYKLDPYELKKRDLQSFFKRLRKLGAEFRYYAVGQYGDTFGRPHYHAIMFGLHPAYLQKLESVWQSGNFGYTRGFVHIRPVSIGRIGYVTGYVTDRIDFKEKRQKPFMLCSRGIGKSYVEKMRGFHSAEDRNYYPSGKFKKALPRYYKNKLYLGEDKFKIAAKTRHELDKILANTVLALSRTNQHPLSAYYTNAENESQLILKAIRDKKLMKQQL